MELERILLAENKDMAQGRIEGKQSQCGRMNAPLID